MIPPQVRVPGSAVLALLAVLAAGCGDSRSTAGSTGSGGENAPRWLDAPYVVLVSFDGFRHDYLDRWPTPAFDRLAEAGVRADALVPPFPSKTFPSHYTLVTGLHPEHHGIVGNTFYDPSLDRWFSLSDRDAVSDGSFYGGEPIWVTAERQGMVSASFFWVGSEAAVDGVRPTRWMAFDDRIPYEVRVDSILAWLDRPPSRRPHLVTAYFAATDAAGHRHGPGAPETGEAVARVDAVLGVLLDGIAALHHGDRVHVIVVSDHGMAAYGPDDFRRVPVSAMDGVLAVVRGGHGNLHVREGGSDRVGGLVDSLRAALPEVGVYAASDVPERLGYGEHPAVGDIVLVPPLPLYLVPDTGRTAPGGGWSGHTHGWDPAHPEMHGIFEAAGPGLVRGSRLGRVAAVDVYSLVAHLLGLTPAPVDGSLDRWGTVLEGKGGGAP